jgi:hypothetical protein
MHDQNFQIPSAASDYRKYSFFPRTIRDWNALPPHGVVTAPSVEAFKASLTKMNYNSYIFFWRGGSVCAPMSPCISIQGVLEFDLHLIYYCGCWLHMLLLFFGPFLFDRSLSDDKDPKLGWCILLMDEPMLCMRFALLW